MTTASSGTGGGWRYYNEHSPDIAYNSKENIFLVVWTQYCNDSMGVLSESGTDIYGSIVYFKDNDIKAKNSTIPLSRDANDRYYQSEPSACYSSADEKYIVVWREDGDEAYLVEAIAVGDDGEVYLNKKAVIAVKFL